MAVVIPIGVGIDLVEVERIRVALERTPTLETSVYTEAEIAYCRAARTPWERFAARWAAKEAVVKCLGGGVPGLDLRGIEVCHGTDGAPLVSLTGEAAARARDRGVDSWLLSMTHTATVAEAIALALGPPGA